MMNNPVIYVFLNKDLHMTTGKASAQVAHAVVLSMIESAAFDGPAWKEAAHRKIVVLEARDGDHLQNIDYYLKERKFETSLVIDEGANEIDGYVETAMATRILDLDDERVRKVFDTFKSYRDLVNITTTFER